MSKKGCTPHVCCMCGNCILAFVVVDEVTSTSSVCISLIPALLLLLLLVEELVVDVGNTYGGGVDADADDDGVCDWLPFSFSSSCDWNSLVHE